MASRVAAMLTSALMLAVALNFEPTRVGMTALILSGPNPMRRLSAFLSGIYTMGLIVGLLVLFIFHRAFLGSSEFGAAKVQIGIGFAALVLAALIAANIKLPTRSRSKSGVTADAQQNELDLDKVGLLIKLLTHSARVTSESPPWVLAVLGMACSLPSIDFLAVLVLIASSEAPALSQIGVLLLFLTVGNSATVLPLLSYSIAPSKTIDKVQAFQRWIRSRSRRDVAVMLALLGTFFIAAGATNL
jgi:hypothetical protein